MKTALLPCPFCGEEPIVEKHPNEPMWKLTHQCSAVGPIMLDWTEARLIFRWNARAKP